MNIVICEDERFWRNEIKGVISKWARERLVNVNFFCYASSEDLLSHFSERTNEDVLYLDISLGLEKQDGMALANSLRKKGYHNPIIFVTADPNRAIDGYQFGALGYLLKPINEKLLTLYMDKILEKQQDNSTIKISNSFGTTYVRVSDILYVESIDHTIICHTNTINYSCRMKLSEIHNILDGRGFVQVHRSFVVSLRKIHSIKTTYPYALILKKEQGTIEIPVSRKRIDNLLNLYSHSVLERIT